MAKLSHPFSGRKGSAVRDDFVIRLYQSQLGKCRMCHKPVDASLRGKRDESAAAVDHIRPWKLRPDISMALDNLQLICRSCHATCDSIEKNNWPDADMIAAIKQRVSEDW